VKNIMKKETTAERIQESVAHISRLSENHGNALLSVGGILFNSSNTLLLPLVSVSLCLLSSSLTQLSSLRDFILLSLLLFSLFSNFSRRLLDLPISLLCISTPRLLYPPLFSNPFNSVLSIVQLCSVFLETNKIQILKSLLTSLLTLRQEVYHPQATPSPSLLSLLLFPLPPPVLVEENSVRIECLSNNTFLP
jgi:hypothetical protein